MANRGSRGGEFWALAHLFLIGTACLHSQEAIGMIRKPWNCLAVWNRFCTFLGFFKFGSCSCASLSPCFRSANLQYKYRDGLGFKTWSQSFSIIDLDFDLIPLNIFPKISKFNLFVHTNALHDPKLMLAGDRTWNMYKIFGFQCFGFFYDLFWL